MHFKISLIFTNSLHFSLILRKFYFEKENQWVLF